MLKLNRVQRIKDRFLSEDKMTKQRPMTKAQLQLISAKYHLLYNSISYYFFSEAAVSICPPAQTQSNTLKFSFTFSFHITFSLH